jgi:aerobic-type carbon monoxide dehydrogenase small subunit (CoxS/CutS family)
MPKLIELTVNRKSYKVDVEPDDLLVDVLRDKLGLLGTKKGCATGDCGVCTVLMNERPVTSCLVLAIAAEGKLIQTIEGIAPKDQLHPLQESFITHGAIQCGYCTPGFIMTSKALLDQKPNPREDEIRQSIAGNLCRCTGYTRIVDAIQAVAKDSYKVRDEE